jgi:transglutaminase-like putative cysteine protease
MMGYEFEVPCDCFELSFEVVERSRATLNSFASLEETVSGFLGGGFAFVTLSRRVGRRNCTCGLSVRYCDTQKLSDFAWQTFGNSKTGWDPVQAICDFVHNHITFGYCYARDDRTAFDAHHERVGVCRDFTHLAVALCRCMNIPARYCTGYLGDIGVPPDPAPMDFSAWFEAFLEGRWFTFDARHNRPRIGRVVIARGRDAADVAISTSFGPTRLATFKVITEEVTSEQVTERNLPLRLNVA